MLTTFDPDKGPLFQGEFTEVAVVDPAIPGHRPNLVLDRTKDYRVHLEWRIQGFDVPLYLAALANNWQVAVYAESMGPGPERRIAIDTVPVAAGTNSVGGAGQPRVSWEADLDVPANSLPEDTGNNSGVYKLVATVFLNSTLGSPGFDIAGFAEGPIIRIEDPR